MSNPISYYTCEESENLHGVNGAGWYFWNETWSDCYGPYDTEEEAKEELNRYCVEELGIDIPSSDGVDSEF
jgi:hypothetical protein